MKEQNFGKSNNRSHSTWRSVLQHTMVLSCQNNLYHKLRGRTCACDSVRKKIQDEDAAQAGIFREKDHGHTFPCLFSMLLSVSPMKQVSLLCHRCSAARWSHKYASQQCMSPG